MALIKFTRNYRDDSTDRGFPSEFSTECGTKIEGGPKFCPECGVKM